MAASMFSVLCRELNKVPRCLEQMTSMSLLRQGSLLVEARGSNRLHSYCQSSGNEPDKLYKSLEIEVKGHDLAVMKSYEQFVCMAARELDVNVSKVWSPPKVIKRWTLLKSVHIYAKHKVQYETRTHFRTIEMKHVTGSTADTLLEYIQRNLPEGMAMKVTRRAIEALPEHLTPPVFPLGASAEAESTEKQPST